MGLHKTIETDNRKMSLNITIKCSGKRQFKVWAQDYEHQNSVYADRTIVVDGSRTIYFSLPASPKIVFLGCIDLGNPPSQDFSFEVVEGALKTYNIWMDEETAQFYKFSVQFSQQCGYENASPKGRMFRTKDEHFRIKYFPVIRDYMTGAAMNTPARIGHTTGIIEVSQAKVLKYTVAMREIILLHEFSHKYKNPKMGLPIKSESGADVNALYIFLGNGWSKVDCIWVFANVFLKAQTPDNLRRMRVIVDYIDRFEKGEFAKQN